MAFNANIPLGTDFILQSFFQLRANFQEINRAMSVNHASMAVDGTTAGQHTNLTIRPQTVDPTTSADEISLYQKVVNGEPNLFFAPNNSQTPIQLTYPSVLVTQVAGGTFFYNTFIAGPFIVYGGFINNPTQGQNVVLAPPSTLIYIDLTIAFNSFTIPQGLPIVATPTNVAGSSFDITFPTLLVPSPAIRFGVYFMGIGIP